MASVWISSTFLLLCSLVLILTQTDNTFGAAVKDQSENDVLQEYKELEHLVHALEEAIEEREQKDKDKKFQEEDGEQKKDQDKKVPEEDGKTHFEARGLKETFFKKAQGLKKTYKSKSFLPQTPVDFLRIASVGAEIVNSPTGGATFGIFTGAATCLNVFCSPMSLVYYILMGLSTVEDLIVGTGEAIETANDDVLKSTTSLPWIGSATKVASKFIDVSVEPVMGKLEMGTKAVTKPLGFAYNISLAVTNMCIDTKTLMMSVNLLAWMKDLENGNTAYRDDLMVLSDYMKEECGAILDKLPTMSKIIEGLVAAGVYIGDNVDGEDVVNIVSKEAKLTNNGFAAAKKRELLDLAARAVPSGPDALADKDPITQKLKDIRKAVTKAKEQMVKFEPIIAFFDVVKNVMDKVLDFELRIPIGPYGPLLGLALQIGEELVSGMVDAVDKLKSGDVVGAAKELGETVGNVNNLVNQQIVAVAGFAEDAAEEVYDGLKSAGTDVANWMNGAGNEIKDGISSAGEAISSTFSSGASAMKSFFNGWKRKKRALEAQRDGQSPNYQYYRNMSLVRTSRGFNPSDITKLGDYICGFFICITPRDILNFGRTLIDTILKPFEIIITTALKPALDYLKGLFASIFPNMDFLDDITGLSITMLPVSDMTKLFNILNTNDLFAYVASSAPSALGANCMKYIKGFVHLEPTYTAGQVKCACIDKGANCGKKKRSLDEERSVSAHPTNCRYTGVPYQGKLSTTTSGKTCTDWTAHSANIQGKTLPEKSLILAKNYCRNPGNSKKSPWCFTGSQSNEWEYCTLPLCRQACIATGQQETTGKWSVTGMGKKCQPWAAKLPHVFTASQFAEKTVSEAEDYCRNPGNHAYGPHCVTTTYGLSMDVCDIPFCDSMSEVVAGFKEHLYRDCPGNDIQYFSGNLLYNCLKECNTLSNCHAVGHHPSSKQCWLKSSCDMVNNFPYTSSMNAYIKSDAPDYQEFANQKCGGNDIGNGAKIVDSVRECREFCDTEPRCLAFEYSGKNCYIKHTCDTKTSASGVKTFVREAKSFAKYSDRDCLGNDIRADTKVFSPGRCEATCKSLSNCGAFTINHSNGDCYLKKSCRENAMNLKAAHDTYILNYATDYERHMYEDCPGNDIKWMSIESPKQCAEECSKDTLCVAFGVKITSCWLKHTCDQANLKSSDVDIHLKKDVMFFHRNNHKDCWGNDFDHFEGSLDKCASSCWKHSSCKAFHFLPMSNVKGKCWLKAKCETSTNSGGHQFIRKESIGFERYKGNDCYGNDIGDTITSVTADGCASECKKNKKCYGFVYREGTRNCWIKTKCKISDFKAKGGFESYLETAIDGFKLYHNKDCYGNDIDTINVNGIRECASLCYKMDECVAFGLRVSDFQCWLKRRCVTSEFLDVTTMYTYILQDTSRPHVVEVAHKRPTDQSTDLYPGEQKGASSNAVDGNSGSHYFDNGASETRVQTNPWWSVTLDSVVAVQYITVVNRGDCCSERLHDFDVLVTTDNADPSLSTKWKWCKHRVGVVGNGALDTIKCNSPTFGKNVIIRIPGNSQILTLPEAKVYASTPVYKTACENHDLKVQCPIGDYIQVVSAVYGRSINSVKCPVTFPGGYSTTCTGDSSSLGIVRRACDGNNQCTVRASNVVFGDPCHGTWKYLDVAYNCVHKYQMVCEGTSMTLQCPSGTLIEMMEANYGRKKEAICKAPSWSVANNKCYGVNSLGVVAKVCEAKNSCTVQANNGVFGDPCGGTTKYLEVYYNCR